jgi:glucose-1-phosphate adenylyltransferase
MGLIFPNSFDAHVARMVKLRAMASLPFAGRYRLVDFVVSSMSNCGIDNVYILPNRNYLSLMDHLGTGREWDLARKNGGVHIFPPFAESGNQVAPGRVGGLANVLRLLKDSKEKYVFMADTNMAVNFDFNAMLAEHIATGADVTMAYHEQALPESALSNTDVDKDLYYAFDIEGGRITDISINPTEGKQNLSMNYIVMERELMIKLVSEAFSRGLPHFIRDVLWAQRNELNLHAYKFEGYVSRIWSITSYFEENMKLLDDENLDALFAGNQIYTKVRDDNPTRYIVGAKVSNCILMQDTVVEADAKLEYIITDKNVTVTAGKELKGTDTYPVYIVKHGTV